MLAFFVLASLLSRSTLTIGRSSCKSTSLFGLFFFSSAFAHRCSLYYPLFSSPLYKQNTATGPSSGLSGTTRLTFIHSLNPLLSLSPSFLSTRSLSWPSLVSHIYSGLLLYSVNTKNLRQAKTPVLPSAWLCMLPSRPVSTSKFSAADTC